MVVSFCIPSLNRPEYLVQTLRSICKDEKYSSQFEIIVFNNCSDLSYSLVEAEINVLSNKFNIKYSVSSYRLNIDLSMLEAIKQATGEYLFFIGDDDYLFDDGLECIINLVGEISFDMALFNAVVVNDYTNKQNELIGFSNRIYDSLEMALIELKKFCTYGNILIKRKFINENDFQYLVGTSHAYGCFWLAFFRDLENGINPHIIVPQPSVVNLRVVRKNYHLLEVIFKHANLEHKLYYNVIGEKSKKILEKFEFDFWKKQSSLKQLIKYEMAYKDIMVIKKYNIEFYNKHSIKILFVKLLVKLFSPIKKPIKVILSYKIMSKVLKLIMS